MKIKKPYIILIAALLVTLGVSYFFFVHTTGSVPFHKEESCIIEPNSSCADSLQNVVDSLNNQLLHIKEENDILRNENKILGSCCAENGNR